MKTTPPPIAPKVGKLKPDLAKVTSGVGVAVEAALVVVVGVGVVQLQDDCSGQLAFKQRKVP